MLLELKQKRRRFEKDDPSKKKETPPPKKEEIQTPEKKKKPKQTRDKEDTQPPESKTVRKTEQEQKPYKPPVPPERLLHDALTFDELGRFQHRLTNVVATVMETPFTVRTPHLKLIGKATCNTISAGENPSRNRPAFGILDQPSPLPEYQGRPQTQGRKKGNETASQARIKGGNFAQFWRQ